MKAHGLLFGGMVELLGSVADAGLLDFWVLS